MARKKKEQEQQVEQTEDATEVVPLDEPEAAPVGDEGAQRDAADPYHNPYRPQPYDPPPPGEPPADAPAEEQRPADEPAQRPVYREAEDAEHAAVVAADQHVEESGNVEHK